MTPEEKQAKISALQTKKAELKIEVTRAFTRSTQYYHLHKASERKYDRLKLEYEALDREEKFLSIDITKKMLKDPKIKTSKKSNLPANQKAQALQALKNLSPEARMAIINQFKGA